ncbi:MAG TPA: Gfo/Idh/MocA family oxidoreductase [Tepidisphaeraceae bacterium]|jgi:predicted dehydrogenase|nr:Gfo/Idh/MocA family oxidoreductase [Tepidisphaeraceae bacterium]
MRIAFIGGSGHHYLRRTPLGEHQLAFVADPHDPKASEAFSATLEPSPDLYTDVPAMMTAFKPDVVSIGVVYGHMADAIVACLPFNVPIVTDKPAAASWTAFERIAELCIADPSRTLITEFDFRARPEFRAARLAVRDGRVGRVALITGQKSYRWGTRPAWYAQREHYGSTLLWIASHSIDALRFVTGGEPTCVYAHQANVTRGSKWGTAEDVATAAFALPGGGSAMVHADFLRPAAAASHGDDRLRIVGDHGVVEIIGGRCWLTTTDAASTDITDTATSTGAGPEMLAAALTGGNEYFSTTESLRTAELLLKTRDRADAAR